MSRALGTLLDRVRGSREVLPHLATLEYALRMQGPSSLADASTTVLTKICTQLASLPVADDDAPLQDLQARLLSLLERRSRRSAQSSADDMGTASVVVTELSHSAFMALARQQEGADTAPMTLNVGSD